jgi:hypothetical protein
VLRLRRNTLYYEALDATLQDFPAAPLVNTDETGHQEWIGARAEKDVVTEFCEEATLRIPVEREAKRATLLAAITADGGHLKPLMTSNRNTCEVELFQIGYTPDKVRYASQENDFITAELFACSGPEVLFPYLGGAREKLQCSGYAAII